MPSPLDSENGIDALQGQIVELLGKRLAGHNGLSPGFAGRLRCLIADEVTELNAGEVSDVAEGHMHDQGVTGGLRAHAISIDHVAIAVPDLEAALTVFCDCFGFEMTERRLVEGSFSGMDSAVLRAGSVKLVLVQGTSPESNVSRYIEHYGPGVQHLAIRVDDAQSVVEDLRRRDCALLTGVIRSAGLDQVFTRRDPRTGMQVELISRSENDGFAEDNVRELFQAMERENAF